MYHEMQTQNRAVFTPLLAAALCASLLFFKFPQRLIGGYLWAEDGSLFIRDAYLHGGDSLTVPYAGYLHLLPRLVALVQKVLLPIELAPYFFSIVCLMISAASTAYVFSAARRLPLQRNNNIAALLVSASPWLAPQSGEVFLNITNLQWVLTPAFMVLLWECIATDRLRTVSAYGVSARAAAALCLSLTGPFGVFAIAPTAVYLVISRLNGMTVRKAVFLTIFTAASAAQLLVYLTHRESMPVHDGDWAQAWSVLLIGNAVLPRALLDGHPHLGSVLTVLLISSALWAVVKSEARWMLLGLAFMANIAWIGGMMKTPMGVQAPSWDGVSTRYTYLTNVFMMWSFLLVAAASSSKHVIRLSAIMVCAIVLNGARAFSPHDGIMWSIQRDGSSYHLHMAPGWRTAFSFR